MGAEQFALSVWFENLGDCSVCGALCITTSTHARAAREKGKSFYCPNGHAQVFVETEVQKLHRELTIVKTERDTAQTMLKAERDCHESTRKRRDVLGSKLSELKKRTGNGVCPCCRRTFQNMLRHMKTKHPDFKQGVE
jgi:hypothetical protein